MTTITINIMLPSLVLPRRQVKVLILGALLGVFATGIAYDLASEHSVTLNIFAKTNILGRPYYVPLTEAQNDAFIAALPQIKSAEATRQLKIIYTANCIACANDADAFSKMLNTTPGWQVASMSSQLPSPRQAAGLILQFDPQSVESAKTADDLISALSSAQIPFTFEQAKENKEDIVLFFGQPGR